VQGRVGQTARPSWSVTAKYLKLALGLLQRRDEVRLGTVAFEPVSGSAGAIGSVGHVQQHSLDLVEVPLVHASASDGAVKPS